MSEILLEVKDAKKHFPLRKPMFSSQPPRVVKAVDGVSFTLMKGEALGLIGESGCGKSTVSRLIMGLYDLTAGQVIYKGKDIKEYSRKDYSKQVQMVFQDPYSSLDPRMCVRRIIEEPQGSYPYEQGGEAGKSAAPAGKGRLAGGLPEQISP